MKKGKIAIGIVAVLMIAAMIVTLLVGTFSNEEKTASGLIDETYEKGYIALGKKIFEINQSMTWKKQASENKDFDVDGKDIVKKAAELLGTSYGFGQKGGATIGIAYDANTVKKSGIDCSGLAAWSLTSLGYKFNLTTYADGTYPLGYKGTYSKANVPLDTSHWITNSTTSGTVKFYNEAGVYKDPNGTGDWAFNLSYPRNNKSIYDAYTTNITCNKSNLEGNRINVLKVNDIITSEYRYYMYDLETDEKGNILKDGKGNIRAKELPMGTIVYSHNQGFPDKEHIWIYIGDLGTDNAEKAASKLISMGIINENQVKYVKSTSSSTHWRIESHGNGGVEITNIDPDAGEKDGTKETGTIWAFQVANDYVKEGTYHINLSKRSITDKLETLGDLQTYPCLGGAEFNLKLYRNNVNDPNRDINVVSNEGEMTRVNWDTPTNTTKNSEIKIDNTTVMDKIILEETKAPGNYNLPEVKKFELRVYKKLNGNKYELNKVEVYKEDGKTKLGEASYGTENPRFFINKENNIALDMSGTAITITVLDPQKDGSYQLEVQKIDAKTKKPVSGISFTSQLEGQKSKTVTTGGEEGKATLETQAITKDNYNNVDHYIISENESKLYTTLAGQLNLYVKKAETENGFIVSGISDTNENFRNEITYNAKDTKGNNINCTASLVNGVITLVIENEPIIPPTLKIQKVASEDNKNFLLDTDVTINKKIVNMKTGEQIGDTEVKYKGKIKDEWLENRETMVYEEKEYHPYPEKYVYEIYENEAADGYVNILEDMYIEVSIWCTPYMYTSWKVLPIEGKDVSDEAIRIAKSYISVPNPKQDTRTVEMKIKNPQEDLSYELNLYKHELDSEKAVSGIKFNVTKDGNNLREGGFTTGQSEICLDKVDKAIKGKTYTYVLEENNTNVNIVNQIAKTEVKVTVNEDRTVSANISRVMKKNETEWQDYTEDLRNQVRLEGPDENNKITVKIANSMYYSVRLTKRDYDTKQPLPGAKFTIKETSPKQKQILPNEENQDGSITDYTFIETEANSNSEYVYEISEIEFPDNYLEILKDIKIMLHVKTDSLGKIKPLSSNTNGTYYDFDKEGGLKPSEKNELKKYVELSVNTTNNSINIDVYNKQEKHDYNIQIMKVDKKTGKPLPGAVFSVIYPDTTIKNNLTTDENGIVSLYEEPKQFTERIDDLYAITEVKAPDGAMLIKDTSIIARIHLNDANNSGDLSKARIELSVSKESAEGLDEIDGLDYQVIGDVIQIIIPNEMPEFKFNINKQKLDGESLDGIEFFVQKETPTNENVKYYEEAKDGKLSFTETAMGNTTYTYLIKERCDVLGFNNVLAGLDLKVHVVTDANGRVKEIHNDDRNYTGYELIDVAPGSGHTVEEVQDLFGLELGTETVDGKEIQAVNVTIKNPYEYKVKLVKTDIYGNIINDKVSLELKQGNKTHSVNTNNNFTTNAVMIKLDEEQEWTIRELNVQKPYYNILADKYVKVITKWDSTNNKIKAESLKIYNNDDTEISEADSIYQDVILKDVEISGNTYVLPVQIKNPFIHRIKVTKYEADGKTLLPGATIKVDGEELIKDGKVAESKEAIIDNYRGYGWIIEEANSAANHINVLKDKEILLTVYADNKGNLNEYYYIRDKESHNRLDEADEAYEYVTITVGKDADNVPIVNVDIINPIEYIFEVDKKDTAKNPLSNAYFSIVSPVVKAQSGEYIKYSEKIGITSTNANGEIEGTTNNEGIISYEEKFVEIGKEYEYKIVENGLWNFAITPIPSQYSIYVKVTVNANGTISLGTYENGQNFIVKDSNGNVVTKYNDLITASVDTTGEKPIIKVDIENPVRFNLILNKKLFGNEEANLPGRRFKITNVTTGRVETLISDINGLLGIKEVELREGTYKYIITEETVNDDNAIINPLEGKAIVLNVKVNGNGSISIEKDNEADTTNGLYVYNYTNNQLGEKIPLTNKIYDLVSVKEPYYGTNTTKYIDTGVETIELTVINPEEYEIMLYKIDKDTNEAMNNIEFKVSVHDSRGNEVKLKDSRTFENKVLDKVTTAKIDGYDGVIKIDNILFEKTGLYTIKLSEINVPDEYKQPEDIELQVLITISNGRYTISDIDVKSGESFVDKNNTKIVNDGRKAVIFTKVDNEQIKGKYSINFEKINNKSEEIEGAKIKVTALKDGKEINLYKDDGNVKSKNIIIPGEFEIKKGSIEIPNIRIEEAGKYILRVEEIKQPDKYIGLEKPVDIEITTTLVGTGKDQMYNFNSAKIVAGNEKGLVSIESKPGTWYISIKNQQFDLALRKYITEIEHEGEKTEITNREPDVDVTPLKDGTDTTAIYNHTKEPIGLYVEDIVTYTLRIYNEADISGYAEVVTDHLPEYLEFIDNEFNKSYGWKLDESDKTGKTVKTDYLSRARNEKENLINAYDGKSDKLDSKIIKIQCKVKKGTPVETKVTNIAEISEFVGEGGREVTDRDSQGGNAQIPEGKELEDYRKSEIENGTKYIKGQQDDDDFEKVFVKEFDLSLRKFITGVTNVHGEKTDVTTRIPVFKVDENGNYIYEHTKEPVLVAYQNVVEYTIRVYNEGTVDGYAKEIKDDIPNGLEFLPEDSLNKEYRWIMLDEKGNETDKVNEAKYITTDYLSKEQEKNEGENLLKAFNQKDYEAGKVKEPDYKEVKVAFKVTLPNTSKEIIVNKAQISDDSDSKGGDVTDKDSTPDEWIDGEDDQDIEKIKVQYFDLSLRKWVTKAIVIEDGKTTVHETGHKAEDNPEETVKVDLKKSKVKDVVVKFEYQIRVKNESEIEGYVKEISDYIPQGLKFVQADNPDWKEAEGKVTTDKLKDTLLKKDETAEVTIVLTWINREDNMGLKINVAEISKDYNEFGSPDIDSVPNNQVPGEDDIDDAPVMLTVKTGQTVLYVGLGIAVLTILSSGIVLIKKYVM